MQVEGRIRIPYRWPTGRVGAPYLQGLAEGRLLGLRCANGHVNVPPRARCLCRAGCSDWVPLGDGTVLAHTRDLALVRPDGADTAMLARVPSPRVDLRVRWTKDGFRSLEALGPTDWPSRPLPAPRLQRAGVGIVGCAVLEDAAGLNYMELTFEVVQELLQRTGWSHSRIGTVVSASSDFWDGRTISNMAIQDSAGCAGKSESKVSMDGTFALIYAAARILSGQYDSCLVVAHAKASEGDPRAIARAAFDPVYERPLGVDDHDALALQASRADLPHRVAPDGDGAAALLLAREGPVRLDSFTAVTASHRLGDRDLADTSLLMGHDADVAEIHVASEAQATLWSQALGVPKPDLPPQRGFATGLLNVARVFERLQPGQVGLAHGMGGFVGHSHCVWKLTR